MGSLTISKSGTAWIQDMAAQGKRAVGGWANSPNAAYYASLDTDKPLPKPVAPTAAAVDLKKLHAELDSWSQARDPNGEQQVQDKIKTMAQERSLPAAGNIIDTTA